MNEVELDMEYRIEETVDGLGTSWFTLQQKGLFGWHDAKFCISHRSLKRAQEDYNFKIDMKLMNQTKEVKYHNVE